MRMSRFLAAIALGIGIVISTTDVFAQDVQAAYFVVTNDGSSYQGQLVENVVGQHVTIRLASGELRTFQAGEVRAQGNVGSGATVQQQQQVDALTAIAQMRAQALAQSLAVTPGTPGAPPVAYTGPDAVQIHITKANDSEGTLYGETVSGWQPVCTMPCTTTVDPKVDYKLHNSDAFRFPAGAPLDLIADTGGHRAFRAIGWTMIGLSIAGVALGSLVAGGIFTSNSMAETPDEQKAQQQTRNSNLVAGLTIVGVSAAVLTVGIIFCAIHPSASLTTSSGVRLVKHSGPTLTLRGLAF